MTSSGTGMVLKCNICPKHPSFSDISHLLTHVSSKGHLSCYFKLQVRSNQEPEATRLLAEYDAWYQEQNLATLLADRMQAKRSRREKSDVKRQYTTAAAPVTTVAAAAVPGAAGAPSTSSLENPSSSVVEASSDIKVVEDAIAMIPTSTAQAVNPFPPYLDPRLSYVCPGTPSELPHGLTDVVDCAIGQSACWTDGHHFSEYPEEMNPAASASAAAVAAIAGTTVTSTQNEGVQSGGSDSSSPLMNKTRVGSRPCRRSLRNRKTQDFKTVSNGSQVIDDPFLDDSSCADSDFGEEELKQVKLKGILWPGMDIFDSATEQMRKKRNQKKDDSVLRRMEITSKTIEPTEQVFSPCGTLQVERVITGNPDDYSPIKGETPIPPPSKKRSVRTRRPLSKSEGNIYNLRARVRKGGKGQNQARASLEEISRQALPLLEPENSPLSSGKQFDPFSDDFSMSYANTGTRQRHEFGIYQERDEDEMNHEDDWMIPKPTPSAMSTYPSLRAFQQIHNSNPLSGGCGAAATAAAAATNTSTYPYTFVKPYALHRSSTMPECATNKENVDPYGGTADYPCYFPPPGSQMSFRLLHDSNPFGHGRNPLSCTFSPSLQDEALARNTLKYPAFDSSSSHIKRELSPDGALIDLNREDFANVLHGF